MKKKGLSSTIFNDIIDDHFGGSKNAYMQFEVGNIPPDNNYIYKARTYVSYQGSGNSYYRIKLDSDFVQNASTMEIALVIVHETIHAELIERCIQSGLVLNMGPNGTYTFQNYGNPSPFIGPTIFNALTTYYKNLGNGNPQWNHDQFNILDLREQMSQNLSALHPWLDNQSNPFQNSINSDGTFANLESFFDYLSWNGLEGTQEYNNLNGAEQTKIAYSLQMLSSDYNHNCN